MFRDVTAALAAVPPELAHSAQHDFLTGLPNRLLLDDRIKQATPWRRRHSGQVAVFYLDLDGFKQINDPNSVIHSGTDSCRRSPRP